MGERHHEEYLVYMREAYERDRQQAIVALLADPEAVLLTIEDLRARADKAEVLLAKIARWAECRATIYQKVVQRDDGDELEVQDMKALAVQDMLDIVRMAKGEADR